MGGPDRCMWCSLGTGPNRVARRMALKANSGQGKRRVPGVPRMVLSSQDRAVVQAERFAGRI